MSEQEVGGSGGVAAGVAGGVGAEPRKARKPNRWKVETTRKRTYGVKRLVRDVATATLKGNGIGLRQSPVLDYMTNDDKRIMQRIVGMSV